MLAIKTKKLDGLKLILGITLGASIFILYVNLFRSALIRWDFIIGHLLILGAYPFFFMSIMLAAAYFLLNVRKKNLLAVLPLVISLICLALVSFVPFAQLERNFDFQSNYNRRMELINMIKSGELSVSDPSYDKNVIKLPDKYKDLSSGGEIKMEWQSGNYSIIFYTQRGWVSGFSGFVYRYDALPPSWDEPKNFTKITKLEKLEPQWFYVVVSEL